MTDIFLENTKQALLELKELVSYEERFEEAKRLARPDGLILEFGVFTGQSIRIIHNVFKAPIIGFDSWQGLPEEDPNIPETQHFTKGAFTSPRPTDLHKDIDLIDGWFSHTVPWFFKDIRDPIRFIHIDCDMYISTKHVFDGLGHLIGPDTFIEFDEYGLYPNWEHREHKAFQELVEKYNLNFEYIHKSPGAERVGVLIK